MNNYYFTFGSEHFLFNGMSLFGYWVRVVAEDYDKARGVFIESFTKLYMSSPEKFSWQYNEQNFQPAMFPGGEYMVINQTY
ncbi:MULTISPECIES: hypothetical protein [unclassified Sphingobacterium]|uniref:hypothetical protein n=1 Tax=unclassified Sphingobacterium TaxID=2609468 RepID=UPI0025F93898|nr:MULTISPECIES: hypothetical protein [unclassified Sphingobacterium]